MLGGVNCLSEQPVKRRIEGVTGSISLINLMVYESIVFLYAGLNGFINLYLISVSNVGKSAPLFIFCDKIASSPFPSQVLATDLIASILSPPTPIRE